MSIFDDNSENKNRKFFFFPLRFDSEHCAPFTITFWWGHFWGGWGGLHVLLCDTAKNLIDPESSRKKLYIFVSVYIIHYFYDALDVNKINLAKQSQKKIYFCFWFLYYCGAGAQFQIVLGGAVAPQTLYSIKFKAHLDQSFHLGSQNHFF